jgi:autotransporter passenger strand-loop-strand repeat protein
MPTVSSGGTLNVSSGHTSTGVIVDSGGTLNRPCSRIRGRDMVGAAGRGRRRAIRPLRADFPPLVILGVAISIVMC